MIIKRHRGLNHNIVRRIREIQYSGSHENTTVIGSKRLANLLHVSDITLMNWRKKGKIRGQELAPAVWQYHLKDVLDDLEKLV